MVKKSWEKLEREHKEALDDLKKEDPKLLKIFDKILNNV